jgi:hypothetical protein
MTPGEGSEEFLFSAIVCQFDELFRYSAEFPAITAQFPANSQAIVLHWRWVRLG